MASSITFSHFVHAAQELSDYNPLTVEEGRVSFRSWSFFEFFSYEKQLNRNVWQIFKQAVISQFGQSRIEHICKKYSLDLSKLQTNGSALLPSHIDAISVGLSEVTVEDLRDERGFGPQWMTPHQVHQKVEQLRAHAFSRIRERSSLSDLFIFKMLGRVNPVSFDKFKSLLWPKLSGVSYQTYLETISKWLGHLELEEGSILPGPSIQGVTEYFQVHKKIAEGGLVAYALKPVSSFSLLHPLVIFRPTSTSIFAEDAPQTWLNDCEVHMGSLGYDAAKEQLADLAADPVFCPKDKKIDVAGYSLGGLHMQRFLADNWRKVQKACSFNAPSVESSLAERFAQEINAVPADGDVSLSLKIFRTRDDLAHLVGEKHLGWGVSHPKVHCDIMEVDFVEPAPSTQFSIPAYLTRHLHLFFLDRQLPFIAQRHRRERIDLELDNTLIASAGRYWEQLRLIGGSLLLFPIIYLAHKVFFFTHVYFHVSLFRYSAPRCQYVQTLRSAMGYRFSAGESIS